MPNALEDRLLTPAEVAERLALAPATIANMRFLGRGPKWLTLPNGRTRYRLSDVIAWENSGPSRAVRKRNKILGTWRQPAEPEAATA